MKTHPLFYVGCLKRYVDPQEITYPHQSNETDGDADCESSVVAEEATGKTDSFPASSDPHLATDLKSEEDSAQGAGLSLSNAPRSPNEVSAGCNPGDPSREHRAVPKSVARLDFRDPKSVASVDSRGSKPAVSKQRSVPASERQQGRQPRVGGRNRHCYRAPPALVDAGGNKRFLVWKDVSPPLREAEASDPRPVERIPEEFRLLGTS